MPLSGLSIGAVADRVVVREGGGARWQAESGQYLLAFDGDPADGSLSVIARDKGGATDAQTWFARGAALEARNVRAALQAYVRAIDADVSFVDAYVNCGRLLHDTRHFANAERVYRAAIKACGNDPILFYNLGVLLEDMERPADAMAAYEAALRGNPNFADCHYNLALLCEKLAKPKEAIRHMARYRVLIGGRSK